MDLSIKKTIRIPAGLNPEEVSALKKTLVENMEDLHIPKKYFKEAGDQLEVDSTERLGRYSSRDRTIQFVAAAAIGYGIYRLAKYLSQK